MKEISKSERILALYDELMAGRPVHRARWAASHGVCERSVRRDLDDIRRHLDGENDAGRQKTYILYDRKTGCHRAARLEACELSAEEFARLAEALETGTPLPEAERRPLLRKIFFAAVPEEEKRKLPPETRQLADES